MDKLKEYIKNNYIITNEEALYLGYGRHVLSNLVNAGELERLRNGVYQKKDEIIDNFVLITSNSKRIIFSNQTALYLHDLIDRTPNVFHVSVPQGYNASHLKKRCKNLQIHYIKKELYKKGVSKIKTPLGNIVPVYDIDRTICDIVINRKNIDKQNFLDGIKRYFKSQNKNLRQLINYAKEFGIEEELRKYMEVLL